MDEFSTAVLPLEISRMAPSLPIEEGDPGEDQRRTSPRPALWAANFVCLLLALLFLSGLTRLLVAKWHQPGYSDLLQEWTSAKNWLTGRPIYAPLHDTLPIYFGPQARSVVDFNAHPPPAVLLTLPLALLPYGQAWGWWNVASLVMVLIGLGLLVGGQGLKGKALAWAPLLLVTISSNALKEQIHLGQLNGCLLLLIVGAWLADRRCQPWASGACVGAAAAIKLFPAFFVLYYLGRRDWRACLAAAGSFAALNIVSLTVLGAAAYHDYVTSVLPTLGQFRASWLNSSLIGFWTKILVGKPNQVLPLFFAPAVAQVAIAVSALAVVIAVIWCAARATSRRACDVAFAITSIGMLLVSPITWDHYFLLLLPAIAILWQAQGEASMNRAILSALTGLLLTIRPTWVFWTVIPGTNEFADLLGLPPALVQPWQTLTALSYLCYALVALFGLALLTARATNTSAPS